MSAITDRQEAAKQAAADKKAREDADKKAIAKHFATPEGKHVLELLMRRFGVLTPRFIGGEHGELNALRAARKDGQSDVPLFILGCLKEAGETHITFPI
jgi:hypothetical protein